MPSHHSKDIIGRATNQLLAVEILESVRISETIPISAYSRLSNELGDRLCVLDARINAREADVILEHVNALVATPKGVLAKLATHGLSRVQIGKGGVASFPGYDLFNHIQIPTAPRGATWSDARGAYISSRKEIILGTGSRGYEGTAAHEVGHALGELMGYDNSLRLAVEYRAKSRGSLRKVSAYYPDGRLTDRGKKEFFAETVSLGIMSRGSLKAFFSDAYYTFIVEDVLGL